MGNEMICYKKEELTDKIISELESFMQPCPNLSDDKCNPTHKDFSQIGFLNKGQKLMEVIKNDEEYLKSKNITCEDIAFYMWRAISGKPYHDKNGKNASKEWHDTNHITYNGYQCCPFLKEKLTLGCLCSGGYGDHNFVLVKRDEKDKKVLKFNTLHIHMIEEHHFFQGPMCDSAIENIGYENDPGIPRKGCFRVEPKDIIEFLNIKSGIDTSKLWKNVQIWRKRWNDFSIEEFDNYFKFYEKIAFKIVQHEKTNDDEYMICILPDSYLGQGYSCMGKSYPVIDIKENLQDEFQKEFNLEKKVTIIGITDYPNVMNKINNFQDYIKILKKYDTHKYGGSNWPEEMEKIALDYEVSKGIQSQLNSKLNYTILWKNGKKLSYRDDSRIFKVDGHVFEFPGGMLQWTYYSESDIEYL